MKTVFWHNTIENWLWFGGFLAAGFIFRNLITFVFGKIIFAFIRKDTHGLSAKEFMAQASGPLRLLITAIAFTLAFNELAISSSLRIIPGKLRLSTFLDKFLDAFLIIALTWLFSRILSIFFKIYAKANKSSPKGTLLFLRDLLKILVYLIGFLTILGYVFKQDIVRLITGLGIGGVALALAARETLENLFASFTIFLDKPFKVGDSIDVNSTLSGDVEKIGFRSTRLRAIDGSLLILPNKMMVSQSITNQTDRAYRRVKYVLRLTIVQNIANFERAQNKILELLSQHASKIKPPYTQVDKIGEAYIELLIDYTLDILDFRTFKNEQNQIDGKIIEILNQEQIKVYQHSL